MCKSIALLYGTDEEFAVAFVGWRKPASDPIARKKEERNPFSREKFTKIVYDFEFPFTDSEEFTQTLNWDAVAPLSICEDAEIPVYFFEELGFDGPPLLCRPPDFWNTSLIEVLPARMEDLLNGNIEKSLQQFDPEGFEDDQELFYEIRRELWASLKKGGRLAIFLGPFDG